MIPFDCEEYFISHLLSTNGAKYCIGLLQKEGLLVKGEWVIRISMNENGVYERFDYNLKTKELKTSKKKKTKSKFISASNSIIESNCVIDISNDGMRWEGFCLNHSPFGYGSLFNSLNELVYRGVMIGDKKECFGIEFYPGLSQMEYIGCYWNNKRHGFGMLYDRTGELLYEGDWKCGLSDFETHAIFNVNDDFDKSESSNDDDDFDNSESSSDDDNNEETNEMSNNDSSNAERREEVLNSFDHYLVHSWISELVINEGYGNKFKGDLLICGFDHLEKLEVKNNSFRDVNCLKICDNCVLKSIEIEDSEINSGYPSGAFYNVKRVIVLS